MKLYTYFQSSASYRVRIALNLKGLEPEMEFINLVMGQQQQKSYEEVNPQRVVPTLMDKGRTFRQSLAILEYLEEAYPEPPLLPKDPFARATVRSLALIIAADTSPLGNLKVRKYLETPVGLDKEIVKQWMGHWIAEGLAAFEKTLTRKSHAGAFCHGDAPSMADCCLIPQLFNADRWGCDLGPFPAIRRIREACDKHPAFIAAHPSRQPDAT
jgi:maleylacetoacetate isomerase